MLKIGVLKIELLMLGKTVFTKAKFFPCFRDRTWAKILGFLVIKRKYFFKLYVKLAINTCLFAFLMPRVLTLFMFVKLTNVPITGSTVLLRTLTIFLA